MDWENLVNVLSLLVGSFSLSLSVVAIWLALHHKRTADSVNERTERALGEAKESLRQSMDVMSANLRDSLESMRLDTHTIKESTSAIKESTSYHIDRLYSVQEKIMVSQNPRLRLHETGTAGAVAAAPTPDVDGIASPGPPDT